MVSGQRGCNGICLAFVHINLAYKKDQYYVASAPTVAGLDLKQIKQWKNNPVEDIGYPTTRYTVNNPVEDIGYPTTGYK